MNPTRLMIVACVALTVLCGVTFDRETCASDFDDVLADLTDGMAARIAVVVPDSVSWTLPAYEIALMTAAWGARTHPGELLKDRSAAGGLRLRKALVVAQIALSLLRPERQDQRQLYLS